MPGRMVLSVCDSTKQTIFKHADTLVKLEKEQVTRMCCNRNLELAKLPRGRRGLEIRMIGKKRRYRGR